MPATMWLWLLNHFIWAPFPSPQSISWSPSMDWNLKMHFLICHFVFQRTKLTVWEGHEVCTLVNWYNIFTAVVFVQMSLWAVISVLLPINGSVHYKTGLIILASSNHTANSWLGHWSICCKRGTTPNCMQGVLLARQRETLTWRFILVVHRCSFEQCVELFDRTLYFELMQRTFCEFVSCSHSLTVPRTQLLIANQSMWRSRHKMAKLVIF